jgi:hypothetical protein
VEESVLEELCPADETGGDGRVPCGDGYTCGKSRHECARLVTLDGCPVGQYSCKADPSQCVTDKRDCHCVDDRKFCGWMRNSKGKLARNLTASTFKGGKMADCRASCGAKPTPVTAAKIKPEVHQLLPTTIFNATIVAADEGTGSSADATFPVGKISVLPGAVVASNDSSTDAGLLLSVKQTASSMVQSWEAPNDLHDFVPMSSTVTLETDRTVEIDAQHTNQGIELDLCLALPPTSNIDAVCDQVLARLAPFFVQSLVWNEEANTLVDVSVNASRSIAAANKLHQMAGGCSRGNVADCSCSCLFMTKHLTSFLVADVGQELQGEDTPSLENSKRYNGQVQAEAEASSGQAYDISDGGVGEETRDSAGAGGSAGAIAGAVVAIVVAVAAAAAFVYHRQMSQQQGHRRCDRQPAEAQAGIDSTIAVSVPVNPLMQGDEDKEINGDASGEVAEI